MRVYSLLGFLAGTAIAQNGSLPAPVPPTVTLLYRMDVELGQRFSLGPIPSGEERIVIPIVGGTFAGPRMSGKLELSQTAKEHW